MYEFNSVYKYSSIVKIIPITLLLCSCSSIINDSKHLQTPIIDDKVCQYVASKGIAELINIDSTIYTFQFYPGDIVFSLSMENENNNISHLSLDRNVLIIGKEFKAERMDLVTDIKKNKQACESVYFRIVE